MINVHDHIRLTKVISKKYYLNYRDFEDAMKDFLDSVANLGVHINGFPFYSINRFPEKDETAEMELFISVKESYAEVSEDMRFHSYFSIEDMISITVFNDYEKNTEKAYEELQKFIDENELEQTTPFFNVIGGDDTLQYVALKVGIAEY